MRMALETSGWSSTTRMRLGGPFTWVSAGVFMARGIKTRMQFHTTRKSGDTPPHRMQQNLACSRKKFKGRIRAADDKEVGLEMPAEGTCCHPNQNPILQPFTTVETSHTP